VAGLVLLAAARALADDFTGQWEVTQVLNEREGFPWSREIKYPKQMLLQVQAGQLVGSYTDQQDFSCTFPVVLVLNHGRDLVLAHCGETKSPDAYAPIHHVKLLNGKLHGVVTTNEKLFEWVATRRK
jgi:hypothetical protein